MPWLLLLDEPSEGIQPSIVQEIGEILAGLRKRDKLSLVVVEQNLDLVLDVADRIVVMERGRIEREVDAHAAQAGGLAELLGMGSDADARGARRRARRAAAPARRGARCRAVARRRRRAAPAAPRPLAAPRHRRARPRPRRPALAATGARPFPEVNPCRWSSAPRSSRCSEIVASLHMSMSDHEIGEYLDVLEGTMQAYDRVDAAARLPAARCAIRARRAIGRGAPRTRSAPGT